MCKRTWSACQPLSTTNLRFIFFILASTCSRHDIMAITPPCSGHLRQAGPRGGEAMSATVEIERKFLVTELPADWRSWPQERISQGYLAITDVVEVRLRRRGDRCFQTIKSIGGLVRQELEIELTAEQLTTLWPATEGCRLEKIRYRAQWHGLSLDVDLYEGGHKGLRTVEIEFPSVAASRELVPPPWFGAEITDDQRFKNCNLARTGRIPEPA